MNADCSWLSVPKATGRQKEGKVENTPVYSQLKGAMNQNKKTAKAETKENKVLLQSLMLDIVPKLQFRHINSGIFK